MPPQPAPAVSTWIWAATLLLSISFANGSRDLLLTNSDSNYKCSTNHDIKLTGATLSVKRAPSLAACCALCSKTDGCARWTFYKSKRCYLKRASGWSRISHKGAISGKVTQQSNSEGGSSATSSASNSPSSSSSIKPTASEYATVLGLSWLFYEAQRSGSMPSNNRVAWRRAAHTDDVVPGGWYDAGDYLKLNFPLASAVSFLSWGLLEFEDGYLKAEQKQHAMRNLFAAVDYLKRSHVAKRRYIGQIGHPDSDHSFWGRPEEQKGSRPHYAYDSSTPAADLFGKVAAALASSSLVWRSSNATYAAELLEHAQELYEWGTEKDGKYSSYHKSATASIYPSSDSADDMAWGAYWLYRATSNRNYLEDCVKYWKKKHWDVTVDWDNSGAAVGVALANLVEDGVSVPSGADAKEFTVNEFLKAWTKGNGFLEIVKTPKGMTYPEWSKWGNLQLSTTAAFVALTHAKHTKSASTRNSAIEWARSQVDYAMGSSGRSFVVGYGKNYPEKTHHAGSSCPDRPASCDWKSFKSDKANPQVLYGALVAGPNGPGDDSYRDARNDYISNEVSIGYNSGFTSALAGLVDLL